MPPSVHGSDRVALSYPCLWTFKVIGTDEDGLRAAVADVFQGRACEIALSRQSASRTYTSLNVTATVHDEADRVGLFEALRSHAKVILVL